MATISVDDIVRQLHGPGIDSTNRLAAFLDIASDTPPEVFWPAFQETWSGCDNTWEWRDDLYRTMRSKGPSRPYLRPDDLAFWKSLPDQTTVFRGCDHARRFGMSWTTDKTVAERFAHGHRGIRYPWPVVMEGTISKRSVLTVFNDRMESEVLVRPRAVRPKFMHRWFDLSASGNLNDTTPRTEPITVEWR